MGGYEIDWSLVVQVVVGSGLVSAIVSGWFKRSTNVKLAEIQSQREEDLAKLRSGLAGEQARSANARQVIGPVNDIIIKMHETSRKDIEHLAFPKEKGQILRSAQHDVDHLKTLAGYIDRQTPHLPVSLQELVAAIRNRLPAIVESVAERYAESGHSAEVEEEALRNIRKSQEEWEAAVREAPQPKRSA